MQIQLTSLLVFSCAMAITPGPNNMMLAASGAQFGFRRTLPHIFGITVGMILMLITCAFGLEKLFVRWPIIRLVLQGLSLAYLTYLSYRIATSDIRNADDNTQRHRPLRAYEGALFQIINPKAFAIGTSLISTFSLPKPNYLASILVIGMVMVGVCIPAVSFWTLFGTYIKKGLKQPWLMRAFNITMAALSLGSVLYSLFF